MELVIDDPSFTLKKIFKPNSPLSIVRKDSFGELHHEMYLIQEVVKYDPMNCPERYVDPKEIFGPMDKIRASFNEKHSSLYLEYDNEEEMDKHIIYNNKTSRFLIDIIKEYSLKKIKAKRKRKHLKKVNDEQIQSKEKEINDYLKIRNIQKFK
eukprot:jgi/Orpsp1_1/1179310/evm.model.c7180000068846.1